MVQRGALWSGDLASLSPIAISDQRLDAQLRRDIGAPDVRHLIVVTAENQDVALGATEKAAAALQRLSQRGLLEGFESPALYLPSLAVQRARQRLVSRAVGIARESATRAAGSAIPRRFAQSACAM
jgi:predicted exporter